MRTITVIIQLACIFRAHTQRPTSKRASDAQHSMKKVGNVTFALAQQSMDKSVDKLSDKVADKMVNRVLQASLLHGADLDATTLGKPGHVRMPSQSSLSSLLSPSHSQRIRCQPLWPGFRCQPTMTSGLPLSRGKVQLCQQGRRTPQGRGRTEDRPPDLISKFLQDGCIFLCDNIGSQVAELIIGQLLYLDFDKPQNPINIYISSPQGDPPGLDSYSNALAVHDTMQYVKPEVSTFCLGRSEGMHTLILAGGVKGKRSCLRHARINLRYPGAQTQGQASDIVLFSSEMTRAQESVSELFAAYCNQTRGEIEAATDRVTFMSAKEALDFGVIDEVVKKAPESQKSSNAGWGDGFGDDYGESDASPEMQPLSESGPLG